MERFFGGNPGLVMIRLALAAASTLLGVRERPALPRRSQDPASVGPDIQSLLPSIASTIRHMPARFAWLLVARFVFLLGIYGVQTFAQYYIRDVLRAPDPPQLTGDLLAAITLALIAFALLGGWLGDRFGHVRMHYVAGGVSAVGYALLLGARTPGTLLGVGIVVGVGIGLFLTANWALGTRLVPAAEAGRYLGISNLAGAGAGAVGAYIGGPIADYFTVNVSQIPGLGYVLLFAIYGMLFLLSIFALAGVKSPSIHPGSGVY